MRLWRTGDNEHPVAEVRRPQPIGDTHSLGGPYRERADSAAVPAEAAQVVTNSEGLRGGVPVERFQPSAPERLTEAVTREVLNVRRNDGPPAWPHESSHAAAGIRQRHRDDTARLQQFANARERIDGVDE